MCESISLPYSIKRGDAKICGLFLNSYVFTNLNQCRRIVCRCKVCELLARCGDCCSGVLGLQVVHGEVAAIGQCLTSAPERLQFQPYFAYPARARLTEYCIGARLGLVRSTTSKRMLTQHCPTWHALASAFFFFFLLFKYIYQVVQAYRKHLVGSLLGLEEKSAPDVKAIVLLKNSGRPLKETNASHRLNTSADSALCWDTCSVGEPTSPSPTLTTPVQPALSLGGGMDAGRRLFVLQLHQR